MGNNEELGIEATPTQVCAGAVCRLSDFWDEIAEHTGMEHGIFIDEFFGRIWRDGDTGEKLEAEIDQWDQQPDEMKPLALFQAAFICCAYACQGMKAESNGNLINAWQYTARSNYWLGILIGAWSIRKEKTMSVSDFARAGANARHAENRAIKADVFAWLDANPPHTLDGAAGDISTKVAPVAWRTARDWVNEWKKQKKLRPTGTA